MMLPMERVKIALDEAKESIGAALLPTVQELTTWILQNFIPALEAFISGLTGTDGLNEGLTASQKTAVEWGKKIRGFIETVIDLKDELIALGVILGSIFLSAKVIAGIQALAGAIGLLTTAFAGQRTAAAGAAVATAYATGGVSVLAATAALAAIGGAAFLYGKLKDAGDEVRAQKTGAVGNFSMSVDSSTDRSGVTKSSDKGGGVSTGGVTTGGGTVIGSLPVFPSGLNPTGKGISAGFDVAAARRGEERGNVIINVNAPSAIDEEGFTRAVVLALNNSNARNGGGGATLGGLSAQ